MKRFLLSEPGLMLLVAAASAWLCAAMPVFSQEAYYWTYAQHPDLSYFDHPPAVAWLIWLGTQLFGDNAFGIRFGTLLCGLGTTLLGLSILRDLSVDALGRRAWIVLSLAVPSLSAVHFLANPDPPLVFFWTLTMWAMWGARTGSLRMWLLAGVAAGAALLSKYSAGFLAISGVALLLLDPEMRRQIARPGPWLAVVAAAVVFSPVVLWNVQHEFASFRFQTASRYANAHFGSHWFLQCLSLQVLMLHPLLAVCGPIVLVWCTRRWLAGDRRMLWLLAFSVPMAAYFLVTSLWIQVKANWFTPAYVPLVLAAVAWWRDAAAARALEPAGAPRGVMHGRAVAALVLLVPVCLPLAPFAMTVLPQHRGSSWTGWTEIADIAEKWEDKTDLLDECYGNIFFFAADYRDAAQLTLHLKQNWHAVAHLPPLSAGQPVLAQNVLGRHALEFSQWDDPSALVGHDAVFVLPRPEQRDEMIKMVRQRFDTVTKVDHVAVSRLGVDVYAADIYVCNNYRGPQCLGDASSKHDGH